MPYDIQNEYLWENDAAYDAGIASQPVIPSTAPASGGGTSFASGVGSLFGSLGSLLGSVAQGVGQGIAADVVTRATASGRLPGTEIYQDPTRKPTAANGGVATSILPGISNQALVIGGVVLLGLVGGAILLSSRR